MYRDISIWSKSIRTHCAHKWGQYTPALITTRLTKILDKDSYFSVIVGAAQMRNILETFSNNSASFCPLEVHGIKKFQKQIFAHQRAEIGSGNTKINRGQETYPIRVNARYKVSEALSTGGQTDGQTSRWIQYIPFYLRWSGGIKLCGLGNDYLRRKII